MADLLQLEVLEATMVMFQVTMEAPMMFGLSNLNFNSIIHKLLT
jgi:hypothetical protein